MDVISLAVAKKFGMKANVFKYQGSCAFEDLPTQDNEVGDVWNVTDEFDLDGQHYEAGTNVAWDGEEWDALSASIDTSIFELNSNKVTTLSASSTNTQYPSAKVVYDQLKANTAIFDGYYDSISSISSVFNFGTAKKGLYINRSLPYHLNYTVDGTTQRTVNFRTLLLSIVKEYNSASIGEIIGYAIGTDSGGYGNYFPITIKKASGGINCDIPNYNPTADKDFLLWFLTGRAQNIYGIKTFMDIPKQNNTTAPTQDAQFTNKKYVDDVTATATSAQIQALFGTEGGE